MSRDSVRTAGGTAVLSVLLDLWVEASRSFRLILRLAAAEAFFFLVTQSSWERNRSNEVGI